MIVNNKLGYFSYFTLMLCQEQNERKDIKTFLKLINTQLNKIIITITNTEELRVLSVHYSIMNKFRNSRY